MKIYLAAAALAAALVQPAAAITFPSLTRYVGSGVYDKGGAAVAGAATSVHCSNVSGQSAQVRVLVLNASGGVAVANNQTVPDGRTQTFSTHTTVFFEIPMATGAITQACSTSNRRSRRCSAAP